MLRAAVADYPSGTHLATREIDDFELVWMIRGLAWLSTQDGERPLAPGMLLLIPPGLRHGFRWGDCRHGYLHFRQEEPAGASRGTFACAG